MQEPREDADDGVERLIRRHFDPLASELGWSGPRVEASHSTVEVSYFGERLGVQVQVEPREFFPYVSIFRHTNGVVPRSYQDADRRRWKVSLLQAAQRLGLPYETHKKLQALAGSGDSRDDMLRLACAAARQWWPVVLAQESKVFGD